MQPCAAKVALLKLTWIPPFSKRLFRSAVVKQNTQGMYVGVPTARAHSVTDDYVKFGAGRYHSTSVLSQFCFPSNSEESERSSLSTEAFLKPSLSCIMMTTGEPGNIIVNDSSTKRQRIPEMRNSFSCLTRQKGN